MADEKHPRLIIPNFLSADECKELEFIHKSSSTVGYRPNVFSTTLSHLIATNSSHLIIPFIRIRERLKDKLEEFFGCEYELFVEFTGLISWTRGASIGWHSDNNRPYLKQRDYAAVCYLNSYGKDFNGGIFHFQDGEPKAILPCIGDVVIYTADNRNIHSVDQISEGERITLTLWFSRDGSFDEDAKLVSLLSQKLLPSCMPNSCLPVPAPHNMYWFTEEQISSQQMGFNMCWARLHVLGFNIYPSEVGRCVSDVSELLIGPIQLVRGNELFDHKFVNILHALQAVCFFCWKASSLRTSKVTLSTSNAVELSKLQIEHINGMKSKLLKDHKWAESVFRCVIRKESAEKCFEWAEFMAALAEWEDYVHKLHKQIGLRLPYWITHQSLFDVQLLEK